LGISDEDVLSFATLPVAHIKLQLPLHIEFELGVELAIVLGCFDLIQPNC
jgi:hypothetical protein